MSRDISERAKTALLVIDVQVDVVANAFDRDAVVGNIVELVQRARTAAASVVWVRHSDADLPATTPGWEIVPELLVAADEPVIEKHFRDSFHDTDLEARLADLDVGHLVITGAQTDYCVRWTLHGAHSRGYATTLVSDGHTTDEPWLDGQPSAETLVAHTNLIWESQAVAVPHSAVLPAAEISF